MAVTVTSNAAQISADFSKTGFRVTRRLAVAVRDAGTDVRDRWRANAIATSGTHGTARKSARPLYANSIRAFSRGLVSEIYPDESMPQGGMGVGFELGGANQPPHLDGQFALDDLAPRIMRRFDTIIAEL